MDSYRLFRRAFNAPRRPDSARLMITADAEYRLFINGSYAGRGPAPNPPSAVSVDLLDVSAHLRQGRNVIAVIVYHLGVLSFPRVLGRAGLLAQLDAGTLRMVTDSTWKWRDAWWVPTDERFSVFREFTETLDGRWEPAGWTLPAFDDSGWKPAVEIGPPGTPPWTGMEPRDIPLPDHQTTIPRAFLFMTTCPPGIPARKDVSAQLAAEPRQPGAASVKEPAALLEPDRPACVLDAERRGIVIGLDFGREVSGFPELEVESDRDGAVIDLGYGEGLEKDGRISVRRQNYPDADRMTLRQGWQTLRVFHHRAFRYMALAARGGILRVKTPRVIESGYPVQMRGAFSCSDSRLDRIWETGRHTMRMCMDQGYMDCPWRERGQYIGDGLAEGPVALYAFGDTALMRRFLRQAALCQPADGLLTPAYPSDWIPWHGDRGPWRIPGYGALWAVMLQEYYRATKDDALVNMLRETLRKQMRWFEPHVGPAGLIRSVPEWNFIDWQQLKPESGIACLNLQYLMALQAAESLDPEGGYRDRITRLSESFNAAHWDEARGLYRDMPGTWSVHTNALALLALITESHMAARVIEAMKAPDLVQTASPYFDGFVLRALARHGGHADGLKLIRDKWGPMVDSGATTFWENWAAQWSLCHAWSCEPTAWLSREILGLRFDAPAGRVIFLPHPSGLVWAQGIAPLACGDIFARWEKKGEALLAQVTTPPGVMLEIDLPGSETTTLKVNGNPVESVRGGGRIRATLPAGEYSLSAGE